jgi:SRSO17 transposase
MFEDLTGRVACRLVRVESRRACGLLRGLLAELPRKDCWTIAEHAGDASPYGMQYLLSRAAWDADLVRDDLRDYVIEQLGGDGAVLVGETGDLKKGTATAGVQRQYTGTGGRVENSQIAVFLAYASGAGHAFIDRELYLPRSWLADPARCRAAGIPPGTGFATKPALACCMIARALDAVMPAVGAGGRSTIWSSTRMRCRRSSK